MTQVFKTNITDRGRADIVSLALTQLLGYKEVSLDMEDEDKVLRIESKGIISEKEVVNLLNQLNCTCKVLED